MQDQRSRFCRKADLRCDTNGRKWRPRRLFGGGLCVKSALCVTLFLPACTSGELVAVPLDDRDSSPRGGALKWATYQVLPASCVGRVADNDLSCSSLRSTGRKMQIKSYWRHTNR